MAERSTNLGYHIQLQDTSILAKISRCMDWIIRVALEIELHSNNMKREDGFSLRKSWKLLVCAPKEWNQALAKIMVPFIGPSVHRHPSLIGHCFILLFFLLSPYLQATRSAYPSLSPSILPHFSYPSWHYLLDNLLFPFIFTTHHHYFPCRIILHISFLGHPPLSDPTWEFHPSRPLCTLPPLPLLYPCHSPSLLPLARLSYSACLKNWLLLRCM